MAKFQLSQAAIERRRERDTRDRLTFLTHVKGLCGAAVAACCSDCFDDEFEELLEWSRTQPDPLPGEDRATYWRRIGGRFYDAWHEAATHRMMETEGACDTCGVVADRDDTCRSCGEDTR